MEAIWGPRRPDRLFPGPLEQALADLQPQQQQQPQAGQQQAEQQQAGGEDVGRQRSRDELLRDVQELVLPGTTGVLAGVDGLLEERAWPPQPDNR